MPLVVGGGGIRQQRLPSIRPTLFRTGQSRLTHLVSFRWNNDFSRTNVVLSLKIDAFFQSMVILYGEIEAVWQTIVFCFQTIVVY